MAYPKDPDKYPEIFLRLFNKTLETGHTHISMKLNEARNLRHQLHAWRRAMEDTRSPGFSNLRRIQITVADDGLYLSSKDDVLNKLEEALGEEIEINDDEMDRYLADLDKSLELSNGKE